MATIKATNAKIATAQKGQAAARSTRKVSVATGTTRPMTAKEKATSGRNGATASKATAKATAKAPAKATAPKPESIAFKVAPRKGESQADYVRRALESHPDARPADIAKATGVNPAYVWDIRAAAQRKAAKEQAIASK
jgi:hypothetical protein